MVLYIKKSLFSPHVVMFMILGLVHLDAIVSCDADLPVVPAQQQRKPLKVVTELLQCR